MKEPMTVVEEWMSEPTHSEHDRRSCPRVCMLLDDDGETLRVHIR
jgi:hypothetical protein